MKKAISVCFMLTAFFASGCADDYPKLKTAFDASNFVNYTIESSTDSVLIKTDK